MKQRAARGAFRGWLLGWLPVALIVGWSLAFAQPPPEDAAPAPQAGSAAEPQMSSTPEATPTAELAATESPTPSAAAEATANPTSVPEPSATAGSEVVPGAGGSPPTPAPQAPAPPTHTPTPREVAPRPTRDFAAAPPENSPAARRARPRREPADLEDRRLDRLPAESGGTAPRGASVELLLSGALVGLFSALVGYGAAQSGQRSRRRRARAALATAMLAELRWLDALLRAIVEQGASQSDYPVDHPIIEAGLRELTLFRPETAARIAQFHDLLRSLRYEMTQLRDNPRRWTGRLPEFDRLLKARAAMACRAVPGLLKELRGEGGRPPPPLADRALDAAPGELPPKPFASGESDDWTL